MSIAVPHTRRPRAGTRRQDHARTSAGGGRPVRRVRQEVRDGVAVIAFSAAASTGLAGLITLAVSLVP